MKCPKCGWHTDNPKTNYSERKIDKCTTEQRTVSYCEKFFCSGSVERKHTATEHGEFEMVQWRDKKTNAYMGMTFRCKRCGEERNSDPNAYSDSY